VVVASSRGTGAFGDGQHQGLIIHRRPLDRVHPRPGVAHPQLDGVGHGAAQVELEPISAVEAAGIVEERHPPLGVGQGFGGFGQGHVAGEADGVRHRPGHHPDPLQLQGGRCQHSLQNLGGPVLQSDHPIRVLERSGQVHTTVDVQVVGEVVAVVVQAIVADLGAARVTLGRLVITVEETGAALRAHRRAAGHGEGRVAVAISIVVAPFIDLPVAVVIEVIANFGAGHARHAGVGFSVDASRDPVKTGALAAGVSRSGGADLDPEVRFTARVEDTRRPTRLRHEQRPQVLRLTGPQPQHPDPDQAPHHSAPHASSSPRSTANQPSRTPACPSAICP
jgi:hypothetical protein